MGSRGAKKTAYIDIPLNNNILSKRWCVCLLEAAGWEPVEGL